MSGIVSPLEFHTPGLEDFKFGGTFGVAWMDKPFWQVIHCIPCCHRLLGVDESRP